MEVKIAHVSNMSFTDHTGRNIYGAQDDNSSVQIYVLDTDDRIKKWNSIVETMLRNRKWFGNDMPDRVSGISMSGVEEAKVGEDRVNPEVAVLTATTGITLATLSAMKRMSDLMKELYAFVPYSVVKSSTTPDTKLILPMGLQKTPGGFGFTAPPSERNVLTLYEYGPRSGPKTEHYKYTPHQAPVPRAISRLLRAVEAHHRPMALLTRFASSLWTTTHPRQPDYVRRVQDRLWYDRAGGLKVWSRTFPGRMRVGWKTVDHDEMTSKGSPDEYIPRRGGAIIDCDTLRIYDANGVERFAHPVDIPAIEQLTDPMLATWLGTLVCIFPEQTR